MKLTTLILLPLLFLGFAAVLAPWPHAGAQVSKIETTREARMPVRQVDETIVQPVAKDASVRQSEQVEGEILVKFAAGPKSARRARSINSQIGARVIREFPLTGWQHVRLPFGLDVSAALALYRSMNGVVAAQPNYIYREAVTPNDTYYFDQYGMSQIHAPAAWDTQTGSNAVVVAVIDTGVFYPHEDLNANMWTNPGETGPDVNGNDKATNGIDDDADGYVDDVYGIDSVNHDSNPVDDRGHGTHCAGIVGASGNNGKGVAGVNWNVRLMALKFISQQGEGTTAGAVECFNYVVMMKQRGVNVRVTNNSYGGDDDFALKDAMDVAGDAGILNVCASGNGAANTDVNPFYPASFNSPSIISVAASDSNDNRAGFSNYGLTSVDLAAPGVSVFSTVSDGPMYAYLSGTSMSAPHVAGAAALLLAQYPTMSMASLKATLLNTADVLPQWAGIVATGGRLNVARALQSPTVCIFSLYPASQSFISDGGSGNVNVTTPARCEWTAKSNAAWLTVTSGSSGSGDGFINYAVAANTTGATRNATLTIADQSFNVTQFAPGVGALPTVTLTGPANNSTFVAPSDITLTANASDGDGTIARVDFYVGNTLIGTDTNAPYNTLWSVKSPGTYTLASVATDNDGLSKRSTNVMVTLVPSASISGYVTDSNNAGLANVSMRLDSPYYPTELETQTDASGFYRFLNLPQGYQYVVEPSLPGYTFTPVNQGVSNLNGDKIFNFVATPACTYSITPASQNFPAGGGNGNITLNALQGCAWKVRYDPSWIKISDSDGTGNATLSYSVSPNTSTNTRSVPVDIQGQTFTITQDAAPFSCQFSVSSVDETFSSDGGASSLSVTAPAGCAWTAVSNDSWIQVTGGGSGSGNGTVSYNVAANNGALRTGTMTVAGHTVNITQKAGTNTIQGPSLLQTDSLSRATFFLVRQYSDLFSQRSSR
jgi:subtilisin family serine protease